jgi:hypothetical protein
MEGILWTRQLSPVFLMSDLGLISYPFNILKIPNIFTQNNHFVNGMYHIIKMPHAFE